jgi:hypothetical protein
VETTSGSIQTEKQPVQAPTIEPGELPEATYIWFNAKDAAKYVGVKTPKTITNWIREGTIRTFGNTGTRYKFLISELDAKRRAKLT